jgi:hypothetical protein
MLGQPYLQQAPTLLVQLDLELLLQCHHNLDLQGQAKGAGDLLLQQHHLCRSSATHGVEGVSAQVDELAVGGNLNREVAKGQHW